MVNSTDLLSVNWGSNPHRCTKKLNGNLAHLVEHKFLVFKAAGSTPAKTHRHSLHHSLTTHIISGKTNRYFECIVSTYIGGSNPSLPTKYLKILGGGEIGRRA